MHILAKNRHMYTPRGSGTFRLLRKQHKRKDSAENKALILTCNQQLQQADSVLRLVKPKQIHGLIINKAPIPAKAGRQLYKSINTINYSIFNSPA